jgi:hypothetical protein
MPVDDGLNLISARSVDCQEEEGAVLERRMGPMYESPTILPERGQALQRFGRCPTMWGLAAWGTFYLLA